MPKNARRAWVVRWDGSGRHASIDGRVAGVLRPQISGDLLLRTVEAIYAAHQYAPDEMLEAIRPGGHNPYRAKWGTIRDTATGNHVPWMGEVTCGHNPFLLARQALVWPLRDGTGHVQWEDDPRPDFDTSR